MSISTSAICSAFRATSTVESAVSERAILAPIAIPTRTAEIRASTYPSQRWVS